MRAGFRVLAIVLAIVVLAQFISPGSPPGSNAYPQPYPYPSVFNVFVPLVHQIFGTESPTPVSPTPTVVPPTPTSVPSGWFGEYYANPTLSGDPAFTRYDADIGFDWGTGRPDSRVGYDYFSVRWTRDLNLSYGTFRFHTYTDDGVRLWIDDVLVIDRWVKMEATEYIADVYLGAGPHSVRMEYYEDNGEAVASLWWEGSTNTCPSNQYRAEYYANPTLSGSPASVRCENEVNYDWGYDRPTPAVGFDFFSARWTRTYYFTPGRYVLHTLTDDGVRLWVNGRLLIDRWQKMAPTELEAQADLSGYQAIRLEYYEDDEGAVAKFWWERLD